MSSVQRSVKKLVDYLEEVASFRSICNCIEVLFVAAEGDEQANSNISVTD